MKSSSSSVVSLGIIIVCFGMYYLYLSPTIGEVKGLATKNEEYQKIIDTTKELALKRDEISKQYNNIPESDIEKLNKIIPAEFDSVLFANDINNIAQKHGIQVKGLRSSDSSQNSATSDAPPLPYKIYKVEMTLKGPYTNFIDFLENIESSLQLVDVTELGVKYLKGTDGSIDNSDYRLSINVYSLR
jgi:Tfp pilus assembly protein PilO